MHIILYNRKVYWIERIQMKLITCIVQTMNWLPVAQEIVSRGTFEDAPPLNVPAR